MQNFLEGYQTYTNVDTSVLGVLLDGVVDVSENSTIVVDDMRLVVSYGVTGRGMGVVMFVWTCVVDGLEYGSLGVAFNECGVVFSFGDTLSLYSVGDTFVGVSEEQAVSLALEAVGSYSYVMFGGDVVEGFVVVGSVVKLVVGPVDFVGYELRPYWDVRLFLDGVYPGNVFGVTVFMWASDGEVISVSNMATGGVSYEDGFDGGGGGGLFSFVLFGGLFVVVVVLVVLVVVGLVIKRRK